MITYALALAAQGAAATAPLQESSGGLVEHVVHLGEDCRGSDGVHRRSFRHALDGPSTLFVQAHSEDGDPTLTARLPGGREARPSTGEAPFRPAILVLRLDAPDEHAVELGVELPAPGDVRLVLSAAPDSPASALAMQTAEAALGEHAERLRAGDRSGAEAALGRAVDELLVLTVPRTSQAAAKLLDQVGDAALALGSAEICVRARERVLEFHELHYPERHSDVQLRRLRFGEACELVGDLTRAITALERARSAVVLVPPRNPELSVQIATRLGIALSRVGRIQEARVCFEELIEELERSAMARREVHLMNAKGNLGIALYQMGDLVAAQTTFEELLRSGADVLAPGLRLSLQGNLAMVLAGMGARERAATMQAEVVNGFEALHPAGHPDADRARTNLAATLSVLGRAEEAGRFLEQVLTSGDRASDDPLSLLVRFELGRQHELAGDLDQAREIVEDVLARRERVLAPNHPYVHGTRLVLARLLYRLGEYGTLENELKTLIAALRRRIAGAAGLGRRERAGIARDVASSLRDLHTLARATADACGIERELFALTESARALCLLSPRVPDAAQIDPSVHALRDAWDAATARLVARLDAEPDESTSLEELAREAAVAERAFHGALSERGWLPSPEVTVDGVAARLTSGTAAVAYRRLAQSGEPLPGAGLDDGSDELVASVVLPDGSHRLLSLGTTRSLARLVADWRAAIGRPMGGVPNAGDEAAELEAGNALRALVLDPVLLAAGQPREIWVCLDDALHLVPLDALPAAEDGDAIVADRLDVHVVPTLAGDAAPERGSPVRSWLGVGAIDYGEPRVGSAAPYAALAGTDRETRAIAALVRDAFETELLLGDDASVERVRAAAERSTHLLVATHGFFADERILTWEDPLPAGMAHLDGRFLVTGLAPLSACGLALAGANRGQDGVLLAEELAAWDLGRMELAVLSACETGVGLRRSGQGVASLQAAFHAAGARAVIASLWRVDDASAERLLVRFHERLVADPELDPGSALARAKSELRAERRPTRDWAGWLLTRAW